MQLTKEHQARIAQMVPCACVTAEKDGIRLSDLCADDTDFIAQMIRAALELQLHPLQVRDESSYQKPYQYSEYTSGGGYVDYSVVFLYDVPTEPLREPS